MDEKIVAAVALSIWRKKVGAPDRSVWLIGETYKKRWRDIARAAIEAHAAALAEAGYVIKQKLDPPPKETFAEEVSRLQREIGQRQMRLQYLVCGDPRIRVTVPTSAADQR